MSRKIVQVSAVQAGTDTKTVAVVALDDQGQLWSNFSFHVPGGTRNWKEWEPLPALPALTEEDGMSEFLENPVVG